MPIDNVEKTAKQESEERKLLSAWGNKGSTTAIIRLLEKHLNIDDAEERLCDIQSLSDPTGANSYDPTNIGFDKRFERSSEPGVLYEGSSFINPINDEVLHSYGFKPEQCIRYQEGMDHFITIYESEKLALKAKFENQLSENFDEKSSSSCCNIM